LILVPWPEIALEVDRLRVLIFLAAYSDASSIETTQPRRGTVDNLFVLLPRESAANGTAAALLKSFEDYRGWNRADLPEYFLYYPASQKYAPPSLRAKGSRSSAAENNQPVAIWRRS
jgi:hypothetical protein